METNIETAPVPEMKKYGEMLKRRRKTRGVTLIELSKRTGIEQVDLVGAELGVFNLSASEKKKNREIHETAADYLIQSRRNINR